MTLQAKVQTKRKTKELNVKQGDSEGKFTALGLDVEHSNETL